MKDPRITEHRNLNSAEIDLSSPEEIVRLMNSEDHKVTDAVEMVMPSVSEAVSACESAFRRGGRLIYVGAGTSGRLGVLDASECPPTFGTPPEMVVGIIAGGNAALTRAQEGAEDDVVAAVEDLRVLNITTDDFVVGIAASGSTPYVWAALQQAKLNGATTCIVACTPLDSQLSRFADIHILPIVGPEIVTGSTRLKAGTATKMVLNMISTGAMIRMGKTYSNIMVDLRATNAKLKDRSVRIIMEICDLERDAAADMLSKAGGEVKVALLMALKGVNSSQARDILALHGGIVRKALV